MTGPGYTVDHAGPADRPELERLPDRLSGSSLLRRFHAPVRRIPAGYLDTVTAGDPTAHLSLVARSAAGELIGLVSLNAIERPDHRELGLLVVDGWQGRGVGSALLDEVLRSGLAAGVRLVDAVVLPELVALLQALDRRLPRVWFHREAEAITARYQLGSCWSS